MKIKENTINKIKKYKITKNGLLENDRHFLINKLGFHNLSQSNLLQLKEKSNNIICKKKNSSPFIKNEVEKLNKSSIIKIKKYNSNSHNNKKKKEDEKNIKNIKNNNISNNSSKEIINEFNKKKDIYKSNITLKINKFLNKNKVFSIWPIKPLINNKTVPNTIKVPNNKFSSKYGRNKNYINSFKTTATNSYKDIKNITSSNNMSEAFLKVKIQKRLKSKNINKLQKDKIIKSMNMTSLLNDVKNQKIKNKEQSYKIFNNNISINNNLYNDIKNQNKYINNKNNSHKNNLVIRGRNSKLNLNIVNKTEIINKKRNHSIQNKLVDKKSINADKNKIKNEVKKNFISESENSEDTKKESGLDLHKRFDEKLFINIDKKIIINEKESSNMKFKFERNNTYKKIINQYFNIQSDQNSINYNDKKNNDKQKHLNYFNNLIKKNSYEQNRILNDSNKNENFSSINENNDNINKNFQSSKILNHIQDIQISNDKNTAQTCATVVKNCKISKYLKQPKYNVSQRYISEQITFRSKSQNQNKKFKFIYDIIKENKNVVLIDIRKILKLNDISIFKLLSFSYDNYCSIIRSNSLLRNKINISLKNIFRPVIDDFNLKYKNFLNVLNFSFKPKTIIIGGKNLYLFNLIIQCQIVSKDVNKSYEIGCEYISLGKKYDSKWKFDVHKKEDIKIWICTELDVVNNAFKKFSYTSQVGSFCYQDKIEIQFNIFSKDNNIEPISIEWEEPIINNENPYFFQNSKYISSISFDQLRACEVETQILFWKFKLPNDDDGIVNDFKKIFETFFKIKSISYDVSKFYFFKFVTIANKKGWIKQNKFCTFDINIIDYEENIKNEIQCIYLINSNYYKRTMDIRIGTNVIFYIIDMKR